MDKTYKESLELGTLVLPAVLYDLIFTHQKLEKAKLFLLDWQNATDKTIFPDPKAAILKTISINFTMSKKDRKLLLKAIEENKLL